VDGAPPIGWDLASRYLALPIALVIMQVRLGEGRLQLQLQLQLLMPAVGGGL
jgi:hypothetical protein